jgi:hypothetical protein
MRLDGAIEPERASGETLGGIRRVPADCIRL